MMPKYSEKPVGLLPEQRRSNSRAKQQNRTKGRTKMAANRAQNIRAGPQRGPKRQQIVRKTAEQDHGEDQDSSNTARRRIKRDGTRPSNLVII